MIELKGIGASSGYAMGPVCLLRETEFVVADHLLSSGEVEQEASRFKQTVNEAIRELEGLIHDLQSPHHEERAKILSTHVSLLQDPEYTGEIVNRILEEALNAEAALYAVTDELVSIFSSMDDAYMKERAADFGDVRLRLMRQLRGEKAATLGHTEEPVILVAYDLTPSDTAQLNVEQVSGFVTDIGGKTSHSAIIARSVGIPAVVGMRTITSSVTDGDFIIIDGIEGKVIINPDKDIQAAYKQKKDKYEAKLKSFQVFKDRPSVSSDGHAVELAVNIASPQDALAAKQAGADGIGLFRTEFLFMDRTEAPSEEEQFLAYKAVAGMMGEEAPIVIRTLDVGGDKEIPYLQQSQESNPFLGYRAIRLCLGEPFRELFKTQLRAILRASAFGNIKLMYPMISTLQELREANLLLAEAKSELDQRGERYNVQMEVGIMIEVPAAALIADQLAKEVDFFSIGTNDLVQYTMAADRMNENVTYLTQPFHPAVLRLIHTVIQKAHERGKWVGMCGEMAGNELAIPILLGMGLDEFSMSASCVLPSRALISRLNRSAMSTLAERVLEMDSPDEIQHRISGVVDGLE